ncbi:hypothetical protein [Shewanella xiamenensis]|nr:hypothetical protein [Shewanella xiamenensis]UML92406.1 hypothetical protein MKD32_13250 [Shewanella xiamenensis]
MLIQRLLFSIIFVSIESVFDSMWSLFEGTPVELKQGRVDICYWLFVTG